VLQREAWPHGPLVDLGRVFADRESGIALATYAVTSPVCNLAAEEIDARILTIESLAFGEIDRRARFLEPS
jgi:hypothetical protein